MISVEEYSKNSYYKAPLKFFCDTCKCHQFYSGKIKDSAKINKKDYLKLFIVSVMRHMRNELLDSELALRHSDSFYARADGYEMRVTTPMYLDAVHFWDGKDVLTKIVYPKMNLDKLSEIGEEDVIFELVKENGLLYAKELLTGLMFPVIKTSDTLGKYEADIVASADGYMDNVKYECWINYEPNLMHGGFNNISSFFLEKDMRKVQLQELEKYLSNYDKGYFSRKNKQRRISNIEGYYGRNERKGIFTPVVKEEKVLDDTTNEKQSPINIAMENIESLLYKLGKVNPELKRTKEEQYLLYLNSEKDSLTLTPPTYANLKSLEGELEFILSYAKNGSEDIVETLENIANEYNNGETTPRTIADVDELSKYFLKMKDSYSLLIQRKAIKLLSQLYIYEIYENRDNITLKDLNSSYFKEFIKTIILCINEMIDEGKIENNIFIDSDNLDEYYVLDLIKNIVFVREFTRHLSKEDCKE